MYRNQTEDSKREEGGGAEGATPAGETRLTEQRNPRSSRIDELSTLETVDLINAEDRMVAEAVAEERREIAH
ncbi:MAG: hypothetical protein KY466_16160, partial [Gemmatimonadetes bacterium]|nr:hypothetical protein [Gemmatimonadota bacterium]